MFLIEILILVIGQIAEHGTGFHIVTVNDKIRGQRIYTAFIVKEQTAVFIFAAVKSTVEIIGLIFRSPHYRIIDIGARNLQPGRHILVGKKTVGIRVGHSFELLGGSRGLFCGRFRGGGNGRLTFDCGRCLRGLHGLRRAQFIQRFLHTPVFDPPFYQQDHCSKNTNSRQNK